MSPLRTRLLSAATHVPPLRGGTKELFVDNRTPGYGFVDHLHCRKSVALLSDDAENPYAEILRTELERVPARTKQILMRFDERQLTYSECMRALEAALADLVPRLNPSQLPYATYPSSF
jgi:hypothetical protein